MHDATEIIWNSQRVNITSILFLKIVLTSRHEILRMNGDVFIPIGTALLMPEAKYVTNFMNYAPKGTLWANINWLEIAISSSNVRAAPAKEYNDYINVAIFII